MQTKLKVSDVHKGFDMGETRVEVLRGISFELARGEALAVTGPSGSGKSTLLHLVGTLDRPDSGSVEIDAGDPFALSEPDLARFRNSNIGFVFQEHHLLPQYSVLENVLVPTMAFPGGSDGAEARAGELLERVGLGHRLTHRPAVDLAARLVELTPSGLETVFFADSGSVAVEVAMKMAIQFQYARNRQNKNRFLTIRSGYHGDTFHAMSVCDPVTGMHHLFAAVLPRQLFAPAPACPFGAPWDPAEIAEFERLIERISRLARGQRSFGGGGRRRAGRGRRRIPSSALARSTRFSTPAPATGRAAARPSHAAHRGRPSDLGSCRNGKSRCPASGRQVGRTGDLFQRR